MAAQRNYWVVSPNVGDHQKRSEAWMVEAWKQIIWSEEVAVMGWGINVDRKKNPQGYIMGQRFAGTNAPSIQPSIQRGDVILIARGRTKKEVVAVGVADSESWEDDSSRYRELNEGETVQIRRLKPFQWLEGMDIACLNTVLESALPSNGAMTRRPLDFKNHGIKNLCNWLDRQIENAREPEASRWKRNYNGVAEGPEHKKLADWCANNPQELGLTDVIEVPGLKEFYVCHPNTQDHCDVLFKRRGERYTVIEVETSDAKPGAYQALKYKTLLCASRGYSLTDNRVNAKLVAWKIPDDVRDFCDQYEIDYHEKRV